MRAKRTIRSSTFAAVVLVIAATVLGVACTTQEEPFALGDRATPTPLPEGVKAEDIEPEVHQVCSVEEIRTFQHLVRRVPVSRHVVRYAVLLARATRPQVDVASKHVAEYVSWGAGPRASQHMILGAKALAVLNGQPAVSTDYIRKVAPLVLRHRVLPNYSAAGEGIDAASIVKTVISSVREPLSVA